MSNTRHDIAVQHSSKRSNWRTPPALYHALDREFHFQIDVAADDDNALSEEYLTIAENGLAVDWHTPCGGACFMNPPYRRGDKKAIPPIPAEPIGPWIEKAWTESRRGATVVGVVPFSPQTQWYQRHVMGHVVGVHDVEQSGTYPEPQDGWTCFHCGETFWKDAEAREHFGEHPTAHRWMGHAAMEVRQLPYRVTFIDPDTEEPAANAPGNTCIVVWKPNPGYVGLWQPVVRYWSYRSKETHHA